MPRYAYECFECGHTVEKLEGWDAPAQQPCPECPEQLQRIPSAPAIVFKGKGWYSTDNRKSSWKTRADEDREGGEGGESDGEGGSGDSAESDAPARSDKSDKVAAATD